MLRRIRCWIPLSLLCLAGLACGGESATAPPDGVADTTGAVSFAVVSGQDQTARAGDEQLPEPFVGRLSREAASGRVVFRMVGVHAALDSQIVTGSPVPGAVVCAVSTDSVHKLTPFSPCTNTDSAGKALFFFTPPTTAGEATAEIRGTVDSVPTVFDTAQATVMPGPAATMALAYQALALFVDSTYPAAGLVTSATDQYGNPVATEAAGLAADAPAALSDGTISMGAAGAGHVTVALDALRDTVIVAGLSDLSGRSWTLHSRCAAPAGSTSAIDSADYTFASASLSYAASSTRWPDAVLTGPPPVVGETNATMLLSAGAETVVIWWRGDSTTTETGGASDADLLLMHQMAGDSLVLDPVTQRPGGFRPSGTGTARYVYLADGAPGRFCPFDGTDGVQLDTATLTAAP